MPLGSRALAVEQILDSADRSAPSVAPRSASPGDAHAWTFDAVYEAHASLVWRMVRRLGVPSSAVEDVMQEVFVVVHRRLPDFEERATVRAWLSAIVIRVVRAHLRTVRRKDRTRDAAAPVVDPDSLVDARSRSALELVEQDEAVRELYAVLACMNERRREALVLSELEELTAPEIAKALDVNVNTVSFRLRTARKEFERILFRRRAADSRSQR
jgi:RNA polymerase sigma-70 factor (ECF subfamily)